MAAAFFCCGFLFVMNYDVMQCPLGTGPKLPAFPPLSRPLRHLGKAAALGVFKPAISSNEHISKPACFCLEGAAQKNGLGGSNPTRAQMLVSTASKQTKQNRPSACQRISCQLIFLDLLCPVSFSQFTFWGRFPIPSTLASEAFVEKRQ